LNNEDTPRSVRYYAIGQAIYFALFFALLIGMLGALTYFVDWIEFELPLEISLIVLITLGLSLGFMQGLGTGYAHNPQHKNQHVVIISSGLLISAIMLFSLIYSVAPNDFHINRGGIIGFMLGVAFFGILLVCLAYAQKREELKAIRTKDIE